MYATFNMGVGFALYLSSDDVSQVLDICAENNIKAIDAGYIEESKGAKNLSIVAKKIEYSGESLAVR